MTLEELRPFVDAVIAPGAAEADEAQMLTPSLLAALSSQRLWGWNIAGRFGGTERTTADCGRLHEEIGRKCSSLRALLTVHQMVAGAIGRWGSETQKEAWLGSMAKGEKFGAFALTEAEAGSDARAIRMRADRSGDEFILNGTKKWITGGEIVSVFLVFANLGEGTTAFLVPRESEGMRIKPLRGMLGLRAAMMADVEFQDVRVPAVAMLGPMRFGVEQVALRALQFGRLVLAFGCVGMAKACLEASLTQAVARRQFGVPISQHQLIQRRLADTTVGIRTAELLCQSAALMESVGDPCGALEIMAAKYHAARVAVQSSADAVQILGASGCGPESLVARFYRDSKIMEIIEGTTEVMQIKIAELAGFAV